MPPTKKAKSRSSCQTLLCYRERKGERQKNEDNITIKPHWNKHWKLLSHEFFAEQLHFYFSIHSYVPSVSVCDPCVICNNILVCVSRDIPFFNLPHDFDDLWQYSPTHETKIHEWIKYVKAKQLLKRERETMYKSYVKATN